MSQKAYLSHDDDYDCYRSVAEELDEISAAYKIQLISNYRGYSCFV